MLRMVLLNVLLALYVFSDWALDTSLSVPFVVGVALVGSWLGWYTFRSLPARVISVSLISIVVVGMRWVDWDSRKPFMRDLHAVQPGMTVAQVDAIMGRHLVGTGLRNPYAGNGELQLEDSIIYRHTDAGWGDADWGVVRIEDGRVVSVTFSAD